MKEAPRLINLFIQHCGEMGGHWGMSRSMAQIFALLYLSEQALNANDMVAALGISRSNVSAGLKELQSWRLVQVLHRPGDRHDYFATSQDLWPVLRTLAQEKRRRELEPTLLFLRAALQEDSPDAATRHARNRMREMHDLIDLFNTWLDDMQKLAPDTLERLMRQGSRVSRVLDAINGARKS